MNIGIKNNQRKQKLATGLLGKRIGKLLQILGRSNAELSILFTGDRAMRTLNRQYRGKDKTTDVLSFPFRGPVFRQIQPHVLGDIVISVPQARRQAAAAGHSVGREIDELLVHGLLHLLGYDHERGAREALRMKRKEMQLLKRIAS